MLEDRHGMELYLGLAETPEFGPVLVFGHGGTSIEESRGHCALELPPLDLKLAQAQIDRTRIAKLLAGGPSRPALDRDALAQALVKLSQITIDIPEINWNSISIRWCRAAIWADRPRCAHDPLPSLKGAPDEPEDRGLPSHLTRRNGSRH